MHCLQPPLLATSSPRRAYMQNAATVMYLNEYACRPCMHYEKPQVAGKQAVRHTSYLCVWQLVFWLLFLATGGFVKLFHKFPWFFHDYSGFFKFHDFSMHGTFFSWFSRFSLISKACGNPELCCTCFAYLHVSMLSLFLYNFPHLALLLTFFFSSLLLGLADGDTDSLILVVHLLFQLSCKPLSDSFKFSLFLTVKT